MNHFFLLLSFIIVGCLLGGSEGWWFSRRRRRRRTDCTCKWNWQPCTQTCGGGWKIPKATTNCCYNLPRKRACNTQCCKIDCELGSWGTYGSCSLPCDGGTQNKTRPVLVAPSCGGRACTNRIHSRVCNTDCCAVDCEWGGWGEFGRCSVSCGGGVKMRSRNITAMASCGGRPCKGFSGNEEFCNSHSCPAVNCAWSQWEGWSECSASCGVGYRTRSREISISPEFGGADCEGLRIENRTCNKNCCPVDCTWTDWSGWTPCSGFCGTKGLQYRGRKILREESCGGNACKDELVEQKYCVGCCPVDCEWSEWSEWESCSATCGPGTQSRSRSFLTKVSCFGQQCAGPDNEVRSCNEQCCPVNCEVTDWSSWSDCTATCGTAGIRLRHRNIAVTSSCEGNPCDMLLEEKESCNQACQNGGTLTQEACKCADGWSGVCCEKEEDPILLD